MLRTFVLLLVASFLCAADRPSVGAIRWDAWSGGEVTRQVERSLSPAKHRFRLPWFATIDAAGQAHIDASAPGVMEQEILYAKEAGLDYWAFLTYPEADPMSSALARYLRSPKRGEMGFCLILHQTLSVPSHRWPGELALTLKLLQEPGYQKVGQRPLVYAFGLKLEDPEVRRRLDELHAAAKAAGFDPYFVYMGWHPSSDRLAHSAERFAAVSAYAHPDAEPLYARHVAGLERRSWADALANKVPYVPLVSTGWDKRPRQDNPVSWENDASYANQKTFPRTAEPEEIAAHLARALEFVKANPDVCPARAVIMYAWNEHDEGGWICPTWTPSGRADTARVQAIRKVLRP